MKTLGIKIKNHSEDYFVGISQIFFIKNGFFGAALLLLVFLFNPILFACGVSASLLGYLYSTRYSTPHVLRESGLIPINCFFFGIAMASLFQRTPSFYICLFLGTMMIPLLSKATHEVLQHWKLSPYIIPYVLMIWTILLAGQGTSLTVEPHLLPPDQVFFLSNIPSQLDIPARMLWAVFLSMGRLLFQPDALFGFSIFALVTLFSPRRGAYFFIGTAIATLAAFSLSTGSSSWENGYFSYSAGLIGLALASFPEKFSLKTILVFSVLSSLITMAIESFLKGMQLPALSLPFVLTLWIALLSRVPRLSMSWAQPRLAPQMTPLIHHAVPQKIQERNEIWSRKSAG